MKLNKSFGFLVCLSIIGISSACNFTSPSQSSGEPSTLPSNSSVVESSKVESSVIESSKTESSVVESSKVESSIVESTTETYTLTYVLGFSMENQIVESISKLPDSLLNVEYLGYDFEGWYYDSDYATAVVAGATINADTTLYAKWKLSSGYELASYQLNVDELDTETLSSDKIINRFTITSGTSIRNRIRTWTDPLDSSNTITFNKSIKIGASSNKVIVNSPGNGVLDFYIQNGSSGAATKSICLVHPNNTEEIINYPGTEQSSPVVKFSIPVTEGTYTFKRVSGTDDIYRFDLNCVVPVAEEAGFELVSNGKTEFIEGQDYDYSGIALNIVYGNGRTETLDINDPNVVVNTSNYDKTNPGTYEILVTYKEYDSISVYVDVYQLNSIELGFNQMEKLSQNSAAGNGVYYNQTVKRVYLPTDDFDSSYVSITANVSLNGVTKKVLINPLDVNFDISNFTQTDGTKEIGVSLTLNDKTVSSSFEVYVVSTQPSVINDTVQILVNSQYNGVIGAITDVNGVSYNTFTTIQQALDYLNNLGSDYDSSNKTITLCAGTYKEKIEITIPNLTIIGDNAENTIIEWDSLYGFKDEAGFEHVTDSTQTVAVRDTAINCTIMNVTISNYWNHYSVFDEVFGYNYSEHRALALLVQSDKFIMKNSKLLGYQDTVEFFTGRQYIENTYIAGTTDFIFGTNNTTYFYQCEIHCVATGKVNLDSNGNVSSYKTDGGYITAFKGCNKGESDYVQYGAIFDECNFTADELVAEGNTAIGRTWGAYAAVMIMNSTLDGHISLKGTSTTNKNERYISMNANTTDATVKFTEYNNSGAGAITESVAGCTVLSAEIAQNYNNLSVIFGTKNGNVSYNDAWEITK